MMDNLKKVEKHLDEIHTIDMNDFYKRLKKVGNEFVTRKPYWKNLRKKEEEPVTLF